MLVDSWQRTFQKWKYIYSQWMSKEGVVYLLMILNVHRYANVVLERSLSTNEVHIGVNESILTVMKKFGHKWMDISWKWTAKGVLSCQKNTLCVLCHNHCLGQCLSWWGLMLNQQPSVKKRLICRFFATTKNIGPAIFVQSGNRFLSPGIGITIFFTVYCHSGCIRNGIRKSVTLGQR